MKKILFSFLLIAFALVSYSQSEYLVKVNNQDGSFSFNKEDSLDFVNYIILGASNTSIDQDNDRYIFVGTDRFGVSRLYTASLNTLRLLYQPKLTTTSLQGCKYIGNNKVIAFSTGASGLQMLHIDIVTGQEKQITQLPPMGMSWGNNVVDFNKGHYMFISSNGSANTMVTLNYTTGAVVNNVAFPAGHSLRGLALHSGTGAVYCLTAVSSTMKTYFARADPATGTLTIIKEVPVVNGSVAGASYYTVDEAKGLFFCRIAESAGVTRLLSIDITTGDVKFSPRFDAPANPPGSSGVAENVIEMIYHKKSKTLFALGWRKVTCATDAPVIVVQRDALICAGQSVRLEALLTNCPEMNVVYNWDNGLGSGWEKVVAPKVTTTYTVTVTNTATGQSATGKVTITVRPPLKITLTPDTAICEGKNALLRAVPTGGFEQGYKINWYETGGTWTDTGTPVLVTPTKPTTYKAVLTDGCSKPGDSATVKVSFHPALSVWVPEEDSVCTNSTLLLDAMALGGDPGKYSFYWREYIPSGGWEAHQNPATHTPNVNTTYVVRLGDGCSPDVYDTMHVTVLPIPEAKFVFSPSEGCPPLKVQVQDVSTGTDTLKNYWLAASTEYYGNKIITHEFPQTGKYDISLTVSNEFGCMGSTTHKNAVTVYEKPRAAFTLLPAIKETGEPVYLYNNSHNAAGIVWDMGNGLHFSPAGGDTQYRYDEAGKYPVSLIARNAKGCLDTATQWVDIYEKVHCIIPNAFTPNGDGLNNTFAPVCAGVANYTLTIFNRWGQVVQQCENCAWDGTYAGYPVPEGVYMFKLNTLGDSKRHNMVYGQVNVLR